MYEVAFTNRKAVIEASSRTERKWSEKMEEWRNVFFVLVNRVKYNLYQKLFVGLALSRKQDRVVIDAFSSDENPYEIEFAQSFCIVFDFWGFYRTWHRVASKNILPWFYALVLYLS